MINTNRKQELDKNITQLITAYQQAMQEGDRSDILTKSIVTRSIIDSGRALATRLRTREQGTDDLVQKLEIYYQALHAEDWVEKSKSVIVKTAVIMGLTSGMMLSLVLNFLWALFEGSFSFFRHLLLYPSAFILVNQSLRSVYNEYKNTNSNPSMAGTILSLTVDPAEGQVYALIGGSRPARTFERINQGLTICVGLIVFVIASGLGLAVLQAF